MSLSFVFLFYLSILLPEHVSWFPLLFRQIQINHHNLFPRCLLALVDAVR